MLFGKPKRIVKRILIVEDEPLTAFENETMLEEAGYIVVATHDRYADAVATLDRETIDLILSDIRLSGKRSGIDLARIAKAKNVPVLFATGTEDPILEASRELSQQAPAGSFFEIPGRHHFNAPISREFRAAGVAFLRPTSA